MDMQDCQIGKARKLKLKFPLGKIILITALVTAVIGISFRIQDNTRPAPEVVTISTLEKIINVSELSTFTSVYNGIAVIPNKERPEQVDYYVSYEATVNAGIDFKDIDLSLDEETMTIIVALPEVYITDTEVKIESLDYIFYNTKANQSTVSEQAFKACKADVENESKNQKAIYELARKNAINIMTALLKPIVDQSREGYSLVIG